MQTANRSEDRITFHSVAKGRGRLVVLLLHGNNVLVSVSRSCVCRVLRNEPGDCISVRTDGVTRTS